jgi:hypothetical protein
LNSHSANDLAYFFFANLRVIKVCMYIILATKHITTRIREKKSSNNKFDKYVLRSPIIYFKSESRK